MHSYLRLTYVAKGTFEVTIGTAKKTQGGDVFFTSSLEPQGVGCLAEGLLIDVFHPHREDFIS